MKKLLSILGLVAVVANLGVATVFAQTNVQGEQVISCEGAGTSVSEISTVVFEEAFVGAGSQTTSATMPLTLNVCNPVGAANTQSVGIYATTDFERDVNTSIDITNLAVNAAQDMACSVAGQCHGSISTTVTPATAFAGLTSANKIALYTVQPDTNGTFTNSDAAGGVHFDLTIPAAQPAGTYVASFTVEVVALAL